MLATWSGCSASSILAPLPVLVMDLTSPTMSPRTLTSESLWSWFPICAAISVTVTTGVNFFWKVATDSPTISAMVRRKATPQAEVLMRDRGPSRGGVTALPGNPDRGGGAPDRQAEEEVDDVDGHDGGADRLAHCLAHACGTAGCCVTVVTVDRDDHDREDHHLGERPEDVDGWQEEVEVVVVRPRGLPEVAGRDEPGGCIGGQQAQDVQRHGRDETGNHPGGHQERDTRNTHDLEGIHFLADPHGTQLRGEATTNGGRQREAGDQGGDLAGVEVGGDEAGEGSRAQLVQGGVPLKSHLGAGEERQEGDDADSAADHG